MAAIQLQPSSRMSSSSKLPLATIIFSLIYLPLCSSLWPTDSPTPPPCDSNSTFTYRGNYSQIFYHSDDGSFNFQDSNATFNYHGANSSFSYSSPQMSFNINGLNSSLHYTDLSSSYRVYGHNFSFIFSGPYSGFTFASPNVTFPHYPPPYYSHFYTEYCTLQTFFEYFNAWQSHTFLSYNCTLPSADPVLRWCYEGPRPSYVLLATQLTSNLPKCGLNASYQRGSDLDPLNCRNLPMVRPKIDRSGVFLTCACDPGYVFRSFAKVDCIRESECSNDS